jgi:hypothetical protein
VALQRPEPRTPALKRHPLGVREAYRSTDLERRARLTAQSRSALQ